MFYVTARNRVTRVTLPRAGIVRDILGPSGPGAVPVDLSVEPPLFKYDRSLTSGNVIRLLRIKLAENIVQDLECTIQYSSLDDNPEFEALSYTWKSPFDQMDRETNPLYMRSMLDEAKRAISVGRNPPPA